MPTAQQLTTILNAALQKLWVNEVSLFVDTNGKPRTIHERTIVAKLHHYLYCESQKYLAHIDNKLTWDFEYNRQNGTESKIVFNNRSEPRRIVPDLILHERNSGNNYCVIEVKYSVNTNVEDEYQKDYNSLIDIIRTHNYQYAISVIISDKDAYLTWILDKKIKQPVTIYINKSGASSSEARSSSYGEHIIYYTDKLPQCAKNALNTLTSNNDESND